MCNMMEKLRCIKPQSISDVTVATLKSTNLVLSMLRDERIVGPRLIKVTPFLNRKIVFSVLRSLSQFTTDRRVFFRFFIWTSGNAQFQSRFSCGMTVDMLLEDGNSNPFDLYWNVLDEFKDKKLPVPVDAFLVLMLGYRRLEKVEKVVETFGRMKDYDCKPNVEAYNVLLTVLVRNHLPTLALAVYNLMLKSSTNLNRRTYDVLLDALLQCERIEDAFTLFSEMTVKGISPDVVTYTVIISGLCKGNKPLAAYRMFKTMHLDGCTPDLAAFNALLDGFCKCGKIDRAIFLMKIMKTHFHYVSLRSFSSLIDGLIRVKRINEAEEYFARVIDLGFQPDLILYTIMMRGLCNAGRIKDAMKMFNDMNAKGVTPDTHCYNTIIKGLCDSGHLDAAKSLKLEISRHNEFPNTFTYTILMCGLCRNGLLDEALQIFNDMEKLGCPPSVVTFNALIDGFCKAGKLEKAHKTLLKMEIAPSVYLRLSQGSEPVLDASSLQNKIEEMVFSGRIMKAYKEIMKLSSWVAPDTRTYNILLHGMCKAGMVNRSLKFLNFLQHKSFVPDSVTYATLINGLLMMNRERDAHKLLEQMLEGGYKPKLDVYVTFMTWASKRKNLSAVFDYWLRYVITLPRYENESLGLIEECFRKGDMEKAFRSLLEISMGSSDFHPAPCNIFLACLCDTYMVEGAIKVFSTFEEFKIPVSPAGCVKLIYCLGYREKTEDAIDVAVYMMREGYALGDECDFLLKLLYLRGEATKALELVNRMRSAGYDIESFLGKETRRLLNDDGVPERMLKDGGLSLPLQ